MSKWRDSANNVGTTIRALNESDEQKKEKKRKERDTGRFAVVNHLDNRDIVLHARINECDKAMGSLNSTESGRWSIKTNAGYLYQGRVTRRVFLKRECIFLSFSFLSLSFFF